MLSGLLNVSSPHRHRPLHYYGENEDHDVNDQHDKSQEEEEEPSVEEEELMAHSCATIEEHIIEHLPPSVHKGIRQVNVI